MIHEELLQNSWPKDVQTIMKKEWYVSMWQDQNKELLDKRD